MDKLETEKENPNKRKLIESAKGLFYKHGYRRVTVDEICRNAGVSKMTFYRFFDNKMDLVKALLTEMAEEGVRIYREIMDRDIPFEEKIRETIRLKREGAQQYSEEFMNDIYQDKEGGILPVLQQMSAETMALVMEDYRKAQEDGHIRKDLNLKMIPFFLGRMGQMVSDPTMLALYDNNLHDIMRELTNLFFYGIMETKTPGTDDK